ncbi:hypothetical protein PGT21_021175 [Puccinia graminis f. sp. tritici]|uniref:Uncharacterized protein n=1 Tax=Puccinia graminis f. sp. tritici TaxID=56615 RepID=A0A5B0NR93_PUCGR|nr:hypothetical protein PGT21_021175 [Puccinia graminis f. sp. tritici]KAA1091745.1 hypothetical protein PGTUg99_009961 [Puccinia graminis f. sp. tritici]
MQLLKSFILFSLTTAGCLRAAGQCDKDNPWKYCAERTTIRDDNESNESTTGYSMRSLAKLGPDYKCSSSGRSAKEYCCSYEPQFDDQPSDFVSDLQFKLADCGPAT